jgi:SAM-dependent methyltransferase
LSFRYARLPALAEIDRQFANVVCETVIMHLERPAIAAALRNLARIVRPGGILYVSWRVTEAPDGADQIDARGRRYACFPADEVTGALSGMQVLEHRDRISRSSGKRIGIVVARKAEET